MTYDYPQTRGGWEKCPANPLLGSEEQGTCFDVQVKRNVSGYRMYFSWRKNHSIAVTESPDGIRWGDIRVVLPPDPATGWEDKVNRSCVVDDGDGRMLMWYTGQARKRSLIGLAESTDGGNTFHRTGIEPVMIPEFPWERDSVMNPFVLKDNGIYRMWYAAGETYEPNALGYAESPDGVNWKKSRINPIFCAGTEPYDAARVGGCEVLKRPDGSYIMFYIGYEDIHTARICAAVSPDGIRQWRRLEANPLVSPGRDCWDGDACYKPSVVFEPDNSRWRLWYNGRLKRAEYVGMAEHRGAELE